MLARLGLRRGEVAALKLEDVDWRAGELVIAGKGRRAERLPLPTDVGAAIVAYLQDGRPATALDRSLIVRVRAPHRGLTGGGITQIVFAAAGVSESSGEAGGCVAGGVLHRAEDVREVGALVDA
ncbi:MAG: tyrosine-type recombinase/integrase [Solirubrobacteraceae bacterium]